MTQRLYNEMNAESQLRWLQDFSDVLNKSGERIEVLAKDSRAVWTKDDHAAVQRLFELLAVWQFAEDFCENALHFGDFTRRVYRLPLYIEKVKESLADGLVMTDTSGQRVAVVAPGVPMRRRGRPTKEEVAARLRGEVSVTPDDTPETKKRRVIADMLGLQVVVSGEAPREKNNAELAAERAAKKAKEEKMNPSLFSGDNAEQGEGAAASDVGSVATAPQQQDDAAAVSPCAQLMSDSYEMRMAQDKLHLDQLAWMMSKPLQEQVKLVQSQRIAAESASERAKMLAEKNGNQEEIEEYAEQAKVATEAYLKTYAEVDEELAILHKRLYLDVPFVDGFKKRFKGVDIEKIQYITRPYYEKVRKNDSSIDVRIRTVIEQENPEYAAKMKAEQERKEELAALHRYIMRTDKPASDERVKTMTERIERVRELAGDEVADSYMPVLDKTKEENKKWREDKGKTEAAETAAATDAKPQRTAKAATRKSTKKTKKS